MLAAKRILLCLIAQGLFSIAPLSAAAQQPDLPKPPAGVELTLYTDRDSIKAGDCLGIKIVLVNGSKSILNFAWLSPENGPGILVYVRRPGEAKEIGVFMLHTSSQEIFFRKQPKPGEQFVDHVLLSLYQTKNDFDDDVSRFVFSKTGKYEVRVECAVQGFQPIRSKPLVINVKSNSLPGVTEAFEKKPEWFARALGITGIPAEAAFLDEMRAIVDLFPGDEPIQHQIYWVLPLRDALRDRIAIFSFRQEKDKDLALARLIERAKKKSPVDREIFAILLASHLSQKLPDPDILKKPLDQQLREAEIEDAYVEMAAKIVDQFLTEPGDFRSSLFARIQENRRQAEGRKILHAVSDFKLAAEKPKAFRTLIEQIAKQEDSAREDAVGTVVIALLYDKNPEYFDYAEQLVNTFFKESGRRRNSLLNYISRIRAQAQSPKPN